MGSGRTVAARLRYAGIVALLILAAVACDGGDGPRLTPSPSGFIIVQTELTQSVGSGGWRQLAPMPTPRSEVAVAAVAGKIYVIGGFEEDGSASARVEVYDPRQTPGPRSRRFRSRATTRPP